MNRSFFYPTNSALRIVLFMALVGGQAVLGSRQISANDRIANDRIANDRRADVVDSVLAQATAVSSVSEVKVAEPFTVDIVVSAPAGTNVVFPPVTERLGEFDVVDLQSQMDIPAATVAEQRIWRRRLTLESIVTGELAVPTFEIQVACGDDQEIITTQSIPVRVISVLEDRADATQFRDIHSVVDVVTPPAPSTTWVWWTAAGTGGLFLAMASMAIAVARRKKWLTPREWALYELDELESSSEFQSADSESVARTLSGVLRDFIELQFAISAPVQTTGELMESVRSGQFMEESAAREFEVLFSTADQAKFAGLHLTLASLKDTIEQARLLIERTSKDDSLPTPSCQEVEAN